MFSDGYQANKTISMPRGLVFNGTNCEFDALSSTSVSLATSLADAFILSPRPLALIREMDLYLVSTDIITTKTAYTDVLSAKNKYH